MSVFVETSVIFRILTFIVKIRLFYGFFSHFYFDSRPIPKSSSTSLVLFQATSYTSKAPLGELDYNLHKSNGTFFTDLDIARGHHIYCLFRVGVKKYESPKSKTNSTELSPGRFIMALGGVTCTFKREIKPYRKYEIWTRVLSWDEKWVYVISHVVKPGSMSPTTYSDQPWRRNETPYSKKTASISHKPNQAHKSANSSESSPTLSVHPAVYAVSIAKYAFKRGRVTIPASTFLQACGLLPASPAESSGNPSSTSQSPDVAPLSSSVFMDARLSRLRENTNLKKSVAESDDDLWHTLEAKRLKHLGLAKHVAGLDEGFGLFAADEEVAFARY